MKLSRVLPLLLLPVLAACSASSSDGVSIDSPITSDSAKILELRFSGSLVAASDAPKEQAVLTQLQYLQGILTTADGANGQVGLAKLSNVQETVDGDSKRISFDALVPVAWPKDRAIPADYAVPLPKDIRKLDDFNAKYDGKCGKNEYGVETFWHDFNPKADGCELTDGEVTRANAAVRVSPSETQGKFPEYDRVWSDDTLDVVGVFGVITSFGPNDDGVREMETLVTEAKKLKDFHLDEITPSDTVLKGARITGKLDLDGRSRTVNITALVTSSVESAGDDFDAIYKPASAKADYIYYGGHSGLGKNIASLAARTQVERGKYQIAFLNGCQTFAYLGTAWRDKKIAANGAEADPQGTKDLDIFANTLPAYDDGGESMLAVYRALVAAGTPKSYNDILRVFPARHLAAVFGEEDNAFRP